MPSLGSRVSQAGRLFERPVYRGRQTRTRELVGVRVRVKLGWMFVGRGVRVSI